MISAVGTAKDMGKYNGRKMNTVDVIGIIFDFIGTVIGSFFDSV